MAETHEGKCLCGSVTFTAEIAEKHADVCHCAMCQKWAGGIAMLVDAVSLSVSENEHLGIYKASEWAERGFCKKCGSSLFWRMQDGSHATVSVASLESSEGFTFTKEIFIDEKPDFYSFAQDTDKMTGAEVIAMFTEGQNNG